MNNYTSEIILFHISSAGVTWHWLDFLKKEDGEVKETKVKTGPKPDWLPQKKVRILTIVRKIGPTWRDWY